jgi:N-acetylglucosaminyl-diphospho-decaprenol L-rhamnosyltransferase
MTCTVAVINWNSGNLLRACIQSLLATTPAAGILVIDNASTDASVEAAEGFRNRVNFIRNSVNRGFAAAVNQAFQISGTTYVLILNPDVRVLPGSVQLLEEFMDAHSRVAAVGGYVGEKYLPKKLPSVRSLILENLGFHPLPLGEGRVRVSGFGETRDPHPALRADLSQRERSVEQPAAAALMIRRDAYDEIGGFDEQFYPAWYEDVDFCKRLKVQGWEIFFLPSAEFVHSGGYSADALGNERFLGAYYRNQVRFARKHFGIAGSVAVRASVAIGMIGRMIARPRQAKAYGKVILGVLKGQ